MNLHEIRYFLALSETLNFTRAAEGCNITQPALTRAIQRLEEKLGGTLIHRERGNTHLTEFGRLMLPYFQRMLNHKQAAERRAREFINLKRATLTVGLMCTIGPAAFVELLSDFSSRHSGVGLHLQDGESGLIEMQLTSGVIDVAIYCKPEPASRDVQTYPLFTEKFVVAVAPDHPLAQSPTIRFSDLDGHNYIWRTNCEYADQIDRVFDQLGARIEYPYNSERDDWIQSMVLAGLGFTVIPEFAVSCSGLAVRPLVEPAIERRVVLATMRGRPFSPTVRAFVDHVRRHSWRLTAAAPDPSAGG